MLIPIEFSGFNSFSNSERGTIIFAICPSASNSGIFVVTALYPKTVYPTVAFVKSKYNCLKSGALKPYPTDDLIANFSDNL